MANHWLTEDSFRNCQHKWSQREGGTRKTCHTGVRVSKHGSARVNKQYVHQWEVWKARCPAVEGLIGRRICDHTGAWMTVCRPTLVFLVVGSPFSGAEIASWVPWSMMNMARRRTFCNTASNWYNRQKTSTNQRLVFDHSGISTSCCLLIELDLFSFNLGLGLVKPHMYGLTLDYSFLCIFSYFSYTLWKKQVLMSHNVESADHRWSFESWRSRSGSGSGLKHDSRPRSYPRRALVSRGNTCSVSNSLYVKPGK